MVIWELDFILLDNECTRLFELVKANLDKGNTELDADEIASLIKEDGKIASLLKEYEYRESQETNA